MSTFKTTFTSDIVDLPDVFVWDPVAHGNSFDNLSSEARDAAELPMRKKGQGKFSGERGVQVGDALCVYLKFSAPNFTDWALLIEEGSKKLLDVEGRKGRGPFRDTWRLSRSTAFPPLRRSSAREEWPIP